MILLDTHIWIWWLNRSYRLKNEHRVLLDNKGKEEKALSIISIWEIAKSVETGKRLFNVPVKQWLTEAIEYSQINILPLDLNIILDATSLPGNFHKDPADQLIVATSRVLDLPLITADDKILKYPFVKIFKLQ